MNTEKLSNEAQNPPLSKGDVMQSVCCCINWHPDKEPNKGKKAVCSYCNRPRQTVL
jgi:hypothetical protein